MLDRKTFIQAVLKRPSWALLPLLESGLLDGVPDRAFLQLSYWAMTGKRLDFTHPKTFNDKIAWIKLYDRKPRYQAMADKYRVRPFVAEQLGEDWLIPLIGVWGSVDAVDFDALPRQFVLKCSHGHGGVIVCTDKAALDIFDARRTLQAAFDADYFGRAREWAYKDPQRRVIAEAYIDDQGGARPADYKFMCMNGKVKLVCVSRGLGDFGTGTVSFYLPDGTRAPFRRADYPDYPQDLVPDDTYVRMYRAAEKMARASEALFVRVDFYRVGDWPYFSEFTFYPCGGSIFFEPAFYDEAVGSLLSLPVGG